MAEYSRRPGWLTGWLRDAQIVHYGTAHLQPRDRRIMSPVVRLTTAPRSTCVNGWLSTLFTDNLTTYSPRGTFRVAVC
jgi:hypothetical protein